jgi:hypothetical protein
MKRHILNFRGGYWDGQTLDTASTDPAIVRQAGDCLFLLGDCSIGKGFGGASPGALDYAREHGMEAAKAAGVTGRHQYVVRERDESEDCVRLTLEYSLVQ